MFKTLTTGLLSTSAILIGAGIMAMPEEARADVCAIADSPALTFARTFTEVAPPNDGSVLTCGRDS